MTHSSKDTLFEDAAAEEVNLQLEELEKHSGKDAREIFPRPQKIVKYINSKKSKLMKIIRQRFNATVIPFSS
jgi:vacuolar-type H+-ATPase subunit H